MMILNILCFSIGAILSGIIVKLYSDNKNQKELTVVKTKLETYKTLEERLKAYRNISYEKYADEFAIDFINKFGAELTHIVDNSQSVESVKEFLEME